MFSFIGFAIFWGIFKGIDKAKPTYWKIVSISLLFFGTLLTFLPPIAGSFSDAIDMADKPDHKNVNVLMKIDPNSKKYVDSLKYYVYTATHPETLHFKKLDQSILSQNAIKREIYSQTELDENVISANSVVLKVNYIEKSKNFKVLSLISINPITTYPYIPALLERARNLNFHVPMSWTAVIAYIISMIFSIKYLRSKNPDYDINASSAALIGLIYTILATTTGMVWAKFNWGMYWNWDPRQVSIFILLMIYFAYFALRSSIDNPEQRARLSSVYSIISAVTVPFLVFVAPRITAGLHPGAQDDGTTGPVVDPQKGLLDSSLALTYYLTLAGFIVLFFWMYNLHIRYQKVCKTVE